MYINENIKIDKEKLHPTIIDYIERLEYEYSQNDGTACETFDNLEVFCKGQADNGYMSWRDYDQIIKKYEGVCFD